MKFNKSTESDFWYVEGILGYCVGKIELGVDGYTFYPNNNAEQIGFISEDHDLISAKIKELNRESCIDTTSTFTGNSQ